MNERPGIMGWISDGAGCLAIIVIVLTILFVGQSMGLSDIR